MDTIIAADGKEVTREMLDEWCDALDRDEWPKGWENKSNIVYGHPPVDKGGSSTLSIKIPTAMKQELEREAKKHGTSTSNYAKALLASAMLNAS